jgi:hypothetical protein
MKKLMMFFLIAGSCSITGCSPNATKHPLADGFFIGTTTPLFENSGGSRKLYYRSPGGAQKVIWKHVADPVLVHNGTAVFFGDWDDPENIEGYAYFAVKENGQVIHIRKAVLARAAQKNGALAEEYFKRYVTGKLTAKGDIIEFQFPCGIGTDTPDLFVDLTWNEISEIVDTLTKTGIPHKDKLNWLTYLE